MQPARPDPVAALAQRLAAEPEVEQVILFGSRARGDAAPRADIDLAIAAPAATPARWHAILDLVEAAPTLLQIDLIRLEAASPGFRDEILRTGRLLYARSAA